MFLCKEKFCAGRDWRTPLSSWKKENTAKINKKNKYLIILENKVKCISKFYIKKINQHLKAKYKCYLN